MPSLGGVRFDPRREGLAGTCNCCKLTEAHPLEQIPGWQHMYNDRTKMSKEEGKRRRIGAVRAWLPSGLVQSQVWACSSQVWLVFGSYCIFLLILCLVSHSSLCTFSFNSFFTPYKSEQSCFHNIIHPSHLLFFQEKQN